jgi:hypothetical protein
MHKLPTSVKIICSIIYISIASCASTRIASSWRMPYKEVNISTLKKVLVVALLKDETSRRKAEDEMVTYLQGKGVVSYDYLDNLFNTTNEKIITKTIASNGFDGAILLRLLDVDVEVNYKPGHIDTYPAYYRNFGSYFFKSYPYYKTDALYTTTKTYTVEINIFSIKEDKMIWTGLTKSVNPDGVNKMTKEIIKIVYKRMKHEGFLME